MIAYAFPFDTRTCTPTSLSDSKQRANMGKLSERSSKDHRTPNQSNVEEQDGCKTAVVNLGMPGEIKRQRVGMGYMNGYYCWKPGCMGGCDGESIVWETAWSVVLSGRNENLTRTRVIKCSEPARQTHSAIECIQSQPDRRTLPCSVVRHDNNVFDDLLPSPLVLFVTLLPKHSLPQDTNRWVWFALPFPFHLALVLEKYAVIASFRAVESVSAR
ncbi:hypothetical protein IW261DRAFT_282451 [Armillaria novae-zelandiae]|uniref:Uncharacterized protein n=1 Tax=Armillaria novae-zelandiae TaxID=153914 RepID=A0AA39P4E6_9AGAR|nr:hypothetical protein IW261DRAFT_282451 [Armillaria novae-zelandiae]